MGRGVAGLHAGSEPAAAAATPPTSSTNTGREAEVAAVGAAWLYACTRFGRPMQSMPLVYQELQQRLLWPLPTRISQGEHGDQVNLQDLPIPSPREVTEQTWRTLLRRQARIMDHVGAAREAPCPQQPEPRDDHAQQHATHTTYDSHSMRPVWPVTADPGRAVGHSMRPGRPVTADPGRAVGHSMCPGRAVTAGPGRAVGHSMCPERAVTASPGRAVGVENECPGRTGRNAIVKHMNKQIAQVARKMIADVQDFISIFCIPRDGGVVKEASKRMIVRLTTMVGRWACVLGNICSHRRLRTIGDFITRMPGMREYLDTIARGDVTSQRRDAIVYARCNLTTGDLYVGETEHWNQRVSQHFMATYRHSEKCRRKCGGCAEHKKYMQHQRVEPSQWMMIPVAVCHSKREAEKMESLLWKKRWHANLNSDRADFWKKRCIYQTYVRQSGYRKDRRQVVERPWDRATTVRKVPFTRFMSASTGVQAHNLAELMTATEEITVKYELGKAELTEWRTVRKMYGASEVFFEGRYVSFTQWAAAIRAPQAATEGEVLIRPRRVLRWMQEEESWTKTVEGMNEEELRLLWKTRVKYQNRGVLTSALWSEYEARYTGLNRKPLEVRVPYVEGIPAFKIRRIVRDAIYQMCGVWPYHLVGWHARNVRIITSRPKNIAEIMCNVQKMSADEHTTCRCEEIQAILKRKGQPTLPMREGHICCIGRECMGELHKVMGRNNKNVPYQTGRDLERVWGTTVWTQLPEIMREYMRVEVWTTRLRELLQESEKGCEKGALTTAVVYRARRLLQGMVIAPLDKNNGECSIVCPSLYTQTLQGLYDTHTEKGGYDEVWAQKLTAYRKRKFGKEILKYATSTTQTQGTEADLLQTWEWWYKKQGWHRLAKYDKKGSLGKPYALYKLKNMQDPEVRKTKLHKARPIAPGCKHPMARLMSAVGRAWSFIAKQMRGEHFVLHNTNDVPEKLRVMEAELGDTSTLRHVIVDIEGCYPSMPKDAIRRAMTEMLEEVIAERQKNGHHATTIMIPRSRKQQCTWGIGTKRGCMNIPRKVMLDMVEFDLENAIVRLPGGKLARQRLGIPMGSPISPAMAIITTAWMEKRWMAKLSIQEKESFRAMRYMDDILVRYQQEAVVQRFKKECYLPPLKLEEAEKDTFLETTLIVRKDGGMEYRLKNKNAGCTRQQIWRYHRYDSYAPYMQKFGVLMGALGKVHRMASNENQRRFSGEAKLREFELLGYPRKVLRMACQKMYGVTRAYTWLQLAYE